MNSATYTNTNLHLHLTFAEKSMSFSKLRIVYTYIEISLECLDGWNMDTGKDTGYHMFHSLCNIILYNPTLADKKKLDSTSSRF